MDELQLIDPKDEVLAEIKKVKRDVDGLLEDKERV